MNDALDRLARELALAAPAGRALRAAEYAAYATVYGEGGYGAVQQRESFQPEFDWQVDCLRRLAAQLAT